VYQGSRRKSSSNQRHELRTPAFDSLNIEEQKLRSSLEQEVKTAFYTAGVALIKLNELRLYRNTHLNFDEFCQDIFGYNSDYAYLKMAAARVYQNLIDHLPTNGRQPILPTRQRQLRPIVKAKLDDYAQVEVWQEAIALAQGKIPTGRIVDRAVRLYLEQNNHQINLNPFRTKEICQIVVRGNSRLKGLGGCWCIVDRVHENSCTVNTWNNELEIPVDNLESKGFDDAQFKAIEDIGVRMSQLQNTQKLDKAALWVLDGLARLERPYLTSLEEKLLQVLEQEYLPVPKQIDKNI
jgi:hypothetical protein